MKLSLFLGVFAIMVPAPAVQAANPIVVIETSLGTIKAELYEDKAPITVKNFLSYVDKKHYDGLIFHRVIEDFMIQGGGYDKDQKQLKTEDPIKNESANGLKNERGTLAMARLGMDVGNVRAADSATSQFFINVKYNKGLDRAHASDGVGYCVFGRVIDGMDVVDKIRKVETGPKGKFPKEVPQQDVVIKSIRRADK